jgi:hypothetical protein
MRFFRVFRVFRGYKKTLPRLALGNSQSSRLAPSRRVLACSPSLKKLWAIPVDRLRRRRGTPRSRTRPATPTEFGDSNSKWRQLDPLEPCCVLVQPACRNLTERLLVS